MKETGAAFIVAREMGWGLYLRGIVTRTGKALPNKLLIAAVLNKIPFKPDQNKYYRNYNYYCIIHRMVLFPVNSTIHLLLKQDYWGIFTVSFEYY